MTAPRRAFLFDVDNTLLDNDRFEQDLRDWLLSHLGQPGAAAYWQAFGALRDRLGYVDYLGAAQACRDQDVTDPRWLLVGDYLLSYPFAARLYPGALALIARLSALGPVWLISDGDAVMQPHKLRRAGLWDAVSGQVRIYIHKETMLDVIARNCPADHYVLIDDKPRILGAVKSVWQDRVTTIMPRQGHYALAAPSKESGFGAEIGASTPPPDITVDHIADLIDDPRLFGPI